MRRRLVFVLPSDSHLVSGGNIYNRELLAAARQLRSVDAMSVAEWEREVAAGEPGTFMVDTLNMSEFLRAVGERRPRAQRFVLVVHHLPSLEPGLPVGDPALALEKEALPRFDGFLATSRYTAELLRARGLAQPCLTVSPALAPRPRPPLEYRPGVRGLIVGNLIPRKGVLPFIEALAAAVRAGDSLTVDVVGRSDLDPEHARACLRAARERGLMAGDGAAMIRFRGPVSYEAMDGFYSAASLLLSTSTMETFGMALQEARATGLPILACRGGNAAAHVDEGVSGHLYDSVPDLVAGLMELVRSPGAMRRLFDSAQAARSGGDYTWDAAAREFLRQIDDFERAEGGGERGGSG
jgi:glycosyltransferase involved in cell wall biosynthesis